MPAENNDGWILVWNDEFNEDGAPDPDKWDTPEFKRRNNDDGPDGWWRKENSYLDGDGNLVISVNKIENLNDDNDEFDYSSGAVRSIGKFEQRYGKFEIRCKLPSQPGWWVAFWLFSQSVGHVDSTGVVSSGEDGTEIDIMEGFGWTDGIQHALHWDGYGKYHKSTGKKTVFEGIREDYHIYTLEWDENEYGFFVDGEETWRTSDGGVSKVPAYVKITGELSTQEWAVTEKWANDPAGAKYPDYFLIDWVRVYKKK
ncbi:family 16 glycosylhydrolase [Candidatus Latescibacterota bacterium]